MRRKMYDQLLAWRNDGSRKAFLLVGARQVGKTYLVRKFAAQEFESFVEVNFLEDKDAAALLQGAVDTDDFVSRLSLLGRGSVIPERTLLFLDEVQAAPDMLTIIKFLVEEGRLAVVASGSMLGTELRGYRSFPVGYVRIERLFPLDFEEFCWAQGVSEGLMGQIRAAYREKTPLDGALHERLMRMFRYYLVVGGMPEVVKLYVDSSFDMAVVREAQEQIVQQYRFDITRYAEARAPQIRAVYDAVSSQLDKENKRFVMKSLGDKAQYARFADDFQWLIDAGVVLPTYVVAEPKSPLMRTRQVNKFKLYSSDTGLLLATYPRQSTLDVVEGASSANFGAVYENAVAQALACVNPRLFYYHNNRKGEVDFLIESREGKVVPIEVKSGKDYKLHTALNNLLGTAEYGIEEALVLSSGNVEKEERCEKTVWYLPLYMAFCIAEETDQGLEGIRLVPPVLS
ncbi:MAG: ATP-binding protein [Eggerthellaceae bacterium]|nr:ATP-binding protein [Eggerthellaceae bacterium]